MTWSLTQMQIPWRSSSFGQVSHRELRTLLIKGTAFWTSVLVLPIELLLYQRASRLHRAEPPLILELERAQTFARPAPPNLSNQPPGWFPFTRQKSNCDKQGDRCDKSKSHTAEMMYPTSDWTSKTFICHISDFPATASVKVVQECRNSKHSISGNLPSDFLINASSSDNVDYCCLWSTLSLHKPLPLLAITWNLIISQWNVDLATLPKWNFFRPVNRGLRRSGGITVFLFRP